MFIKRIRLLLRGFVTLVCFLAVVPQWTQASGTLSFRFYGGGAYLSGGDLNAGLKGYSNMYLDLAKLFGYNINGGYKAATLGIEFGGDLIFQITPAIGIGIGSGYISASKESIMSFKNADETVTQTVKPQFNAIPLNMGIFFTIPVSRKIYIILNGGVGYYFAKAKSFWSLNSGEMISEVSTDVKANAIGINGGLAFDLKINTHIGFFIGLSGRYVKISQFDGTGTEKSDGFSDITIGRLYYYETQNWGNGKYYPMVFVFDPKTPPINPPSLANLREAKIDFSGASIRIGLTIHI